MYRKYVYPEVTWCDFRSIVTEEAVEVGSLYNLEDRAIKLMVSVSVRHEVEVFSNCLVVSLMVPCTLQTDEKKRINKKPAHFVLGKDFLLTVRFDDIRGFKDTKKELEKETTVPRNTVDLFVQLLNTMYQHLHRDLLEHLPAIASGHHRYAHKKYLIDYTRMVRKHQGVLATFVSTAKEFFSDLDIESSLQEIGNHYQALEKQLDRQRSPSRHALPRKSESRRGSFFPGRLFNFFVGKSKNGK